MSQLCSEKPKDVHLPSLSRYRTSNGKDLQPRCFHCDVFAAIAEDVLGVHIRIVRSNRIRRVIPWVGRIWDRWDEFLVANRRCPNKAALESSN
jgi:hypothetical protein